MPKRSEREVAWRLDNELRVRYYGEGVVCVDLNFSRMIVKLTVEQVPTS